MSHEYNDDECNRCIHYTRFVTNCDTWTCEVCHLVEMSIVHPTDSRYDIIWGRYQLACSHQAHIRCLRKWCKEKGYVGCPCCGPIEETESNQYCHWCDRFGHAPSSHKK